MTGNEILKLFTEKKIKKAQTGTVLETPIVFFSAKTNPHASSVEFVDPNKRRNPEEKKTETASTETTTSNWWEKYMTESDSPLTSDTTSNESTTSASSKYDKGLSEKFKTDMYLALDQLGFGGETGKTLVAQMGLETRHGEAVPGNFNYGNMTAGSSWTGRTTTAKDNQNGKSYTFRSYDNLQDGLTDYLRLILIYDIKPGDSKEQVTAKLTGLNHGGRKWAEAKNYAKAIDNVYKSYWG